MIGKIFLNALPVILMIGLIPFVQNDFILVAVYLAIIAAAFFIKYKKRDEIFLIFGFVVLSISEYFFVSTRVETFQRQSLLGVMPIWLPVLWGYAFVAIKRSIVILDNNLKK